MDINLSELPLELDVLHNRSSNKVISGIEYPALKDKNIMLDVLRLDLLHPFISGNKWFKLKYNLKNGLLRNAKEIVSFGGAYSNHLHALAYVGMLLKIKTIGIIRGEEVSNHTLNDCIKWGMHLHFVSRNEYRNKKTDEFLEQIQRTYPNAFIIPEGGDNEAGMQGAREMLHGIDLQKYTHICCAVGTGTSLKGLIESSLPQNQIMGFMSIKNGSYLQNELSNLTSKTNWALLHDFHFGGFAKKNNELLNFMQDFRDRYQIELDFIYTAKMMFGIFDMLDKNMFPHNSRILAIHSGGIQGNRSLS